MKKDIFRNCPFCGAEHLVPQHVGKGMLCHCGAYGQTDEESDAYMFIDEAADILGLDAFTVRDKVEIRDGGIILEGDDEDPEKIIIQWAKPRKWGDTWK